MAVQWKQRWRWVCVAVVIVLMVITRFNFSQSSLVGTLQRQCALNQPNPARNVKPQIIAHRGAGVIDPESRTRIGNTMLGIEKAFGEADWIEIDLQKSSDGTLWVFHDKRLSRVAHYSGSKNFGELTDNELRQQRIKVPSQETIPTLEEVLGKFASPSVRFILDIKFASKQGVEDEDAKMLVELVDKYLRRDQVILFGGYDVLRSYKGRGIRLGYTAMWSEGWNKYRFLLGHEFVLNRCRDLKCDYLVLPLVFLNQSLIEESEKNGRKVWAYGISDESDWKDTARRGVTGLIVDDLENARKTFSGADTR